MGSTIFLVSGIKSITWTEPNVSVSDIQNKFILSIQLNKNTNLNMFTLIIKERQGFWGMNQQKLSHMQTRH